MMYRYEAVSRAVAETRGHDGFDVTCEQLTIQWTRSRATALKHNMHAKSYKTKH